MEGGVLEGFARFTGGGTTVPGSPFYKVAGETLARVFFTWV